MTPTGKVVAVVLGLLLLFAVWEYAPPMWGGLLLFVLVLVLAAKALKRPAAPVTAPLTP